MTRLRNGREQKSNQRIRIGALLLLACVWAGCSAAGQAPRWERGVVWTPEMGPPAGFAPTARDTSSTLFPGPFFVDAPTLHNLGFRWYIEGDVDRQARVEVSYRQQGASEWHAALPMLRVQHEIANRQYGPWGCGNLFAGSVMSLEAGTMYEVRFVLHHPDGAGPPAEVMDATFMDGLPGFEAALSEDGLVVTMATRAEPPRYEGERLIRVLPAGHTGEVPDDAAADLAAALEQAGPGDVLLLQPGLHIGSFEISVAGRPDRPLVLRGSQAGPAIVSGREDGEGTLFDVSRSRHVHFENLVLRRARVAIDGGRQGGPGAAWLVVRGCRIEDIAQGIFTTSEQAVHWLITDNIIIGRNPSWYPRTEPGRSYMAPSGTGVNVYGQGHAVGYNHIERFGDALAIANVNLGILDPAPRPERLCVNIDFYHNDLSLAYDDIIETDYGCHNIRVVHNRGYHAHSGISMQPTYGGPIYLIRNVMYSMLRSYKLFNYPTGIVAYHNTSLSQRSGLEGMDFWAKGIWKNNLFLGGLQNSTVRTGSTSPHTRLDYNAYSRNHPDPVTFIRWFDGDTRRLFSTLEEFAAGTGHERHGIEVDYDIFVRAERQQPYEALRDPRKFDLRLQPAAAPVAAGLRLPNVNDDYTGAAPDLGAYESGHPLPHYGPRDGQRLRW